VLWIICKNKIPVAETNEKEQNHTNSSQINHSKGQQSRVLQSTAAS